MPRKQLINSPQGQIEIRQYQASRTEVTGTLAIICHPHPLYGGSMDNKVVYMINKALLELGADTLQFNFRGVGNSSGIHDHGRGESDDLCFLVDWAQQQTSINTLWLAGFSFGSYVALRAATHLSPSLSVSQLLMVAPPVARPEFDNNLQTSMPCLVVQGDHDDVVDINHVKQWIDSRQSPRPRLQIIPEAGHFFSSKLPALRSSIVSYFIKND